MMRERGKVRKDREKQMEITELDRRTEQAI